MTSTYKNSLLEIPSYQLSFYCFKPSIVISFIYKYSDNLIYKERLLMKYGYWTPIFGGWLRNVENENMPATFDYVKKLAQNAEKLGYDMTLIPELFLNDIKGIDGPAMDAWSTTAALAAVTEKLQLLTAIRPGFYNPATLAKTAANIDHISNGRFSLNSTLR